MKWVLRIFIAALLVIITVTAVAWLTFPRYAQSLIDRAVEGTNISIQISNSGLQGLSGITFDRLEAVFDTPPDSCTNSSARYRLTVHNGKLHWKSLQNNNSSATGLIPKILSLDLELEADSINIVQEGGLSFKESNPSVTGNVNIARKEGLTFTFEPESFQYVIENGSLAINNLRFEGINYRFTIDRKGEWIQKPALLSVASLHSDGQSVPLANFEALFGFTQDPENICGITFKECSVDLFGLRAKTPRIDYDPLEEETSFTLLLDSLPLEKLPGFKGTEPDRPFAKGELSGSIPIEFRDSVIRIHNATIRANPGTKLMYYSLEGLPWLSIITPASKNPHDLFTNLNATFALNNENANLPGIALKSLSTGFLGGTLSSGPAVYDAARQKQSFIFKLENIHLPEQIRLHGDFKGSLKGEVSGTVPLSIMEGKFAINNARLSSKGNGSILHTPPRQKKGEKDTIFSSQTSDATYTYSEPDLQLSRDTEGKTTIDFELKQMTRKTSGGTLELLSPKGILDLWHVKNNPSMISLSEFSAGFMDGLVAIEHVDFDMAKHTAETELILDRIPLQKLLDLQGMKKIYATGTVRGKIPVIIKDQLFEIPTGNMDADQTGQIIYSTTPEERAAANESLKLTYEALSNFLYSELISSISMSPDGQSVIRLQLKGVNPSFQEGRPIHLNLNVEQNLLELLKSLTISTSIEQAISEKALQQQ